MLDFDFKCSFRISALPGLVTKVSLETKIKSMHKTNLGLIFGKSFLTLTKEVYENQLDQFQLSF